MKERLKEEQKWLEDQKEALIYETKKIKAKGFDWTTWEFHYYNILSTIGKIQLLEELIEKDA